MRASRGLAEDAVDAREHIVVLELAIGGCASGGRGYVEHFDKLLRLGELLLPHAHPAPSLEPLEERAASRRPRAGGLLDHVERQLERSHTLRATRPVGSVRRVSKAENSIACRGSRPGERTDFSAFLPSPQSMETFGPRPQSPKQLYAETVQPLAAG